MRPVAVSVEGPTEREFVSKVLSPHLAAFGLYAKPIPLNGSVSVARATDDIRRLLKDDGYMAVTTLYDWYGFQKRQQWEKPHQLESELHAQVSGNHRFIPYIQVYEFEALIFAGPDETGEVLRNPQLPAKMRVELRSCHTPEDLNDGYDTCPSRRLKRLHPGYDKVNHGYRITEAIGLDRIRISCPRFGGWLTRLESLGSAGAQPVTSEN
ncbi:DUF4276 family protein [Nitrospirillum sp. BR 11828]|uniref:DUF4276 family protein n=1 Tax=Nitrospirillum sp. BR 11828 TaxID=3104325 RepID=UPI002ACA3633|nr:DUF4276 family protein [Nitrospirillum sp. BR 11828]MDZ5647534.1 DUF4276 family protein [Nitrospirillum sp. BR 11828]